MTRSEFTIIEGRPSGEVEPFLPNQRERYMKDVVTRCKRITSVNSVK